MSTYRPHIDGLRAIAVLSVVCYHVFPNVLRGGFVGVDIFFVISGFLISSIIFENLENHRFSYVDFYARRVKRIFPALITVLLAGWIVGWFVLRPDEFKYLGKSIATGGGFIANFSLWGEAGYFDAASHQKPLLHLWSLAIEEQFYILWPLLLGLVWARRYNFLAITILIGIASFGVNLYSTSTDMTAAFYSPLSRFWELMVGGVLAYLVMHKPLALRWSWIPTIGAILLVGSIFLIHSGKPFPGWRALIPTMGAFCVIAASGSWVNRALSYRPLVFVGLISYPLYLWHWPVLYASRFVEGPDRLEVRLTVISASVVLAWLTYEFIEKPVRRGGKSDLVPAALCAGMVGLIAVGVTSNMTHGFDYRIPEDIRSLANMDGMDVKSEWREGKCFLREGDKDFDESCVDGRNNMVFLWGDSHAAALYPGLKHLQAERGFGIAQFTSSACPPLLDWDGYKGCKEKNVIALNAVAREKPRTVILHADWKRFPNLKDLERTVGELKKSGVQYVYLVGPVPQWKRSLPTMLWECRKLNGHDNESPTSFSSCGLDPSIAAIDDTLSQMASTMGIKYLSAYKAMCTANGCVTKIDDKFLSTFDHGHLSAEGSTFLLTKLSARL